MRARAGAEVFELPDAAPAKAASPQDTALAASSGGLPPTEGQQPIILTLAGLNWFTSLGTKEYAFVCLVNIFLVSQSPWKTIEKDGKSLMVSDLILADPYIGKVPPQPAR